MGIATLNIKKQDLLTMKNPDGTTGFMQRGGQFVLAFSDTLYAACRNWVKKHNTNVTCELAKNGMNSSYFSNARAKYLRVTGDTANEEGFGLYAKDKYEKICKTFHVKPEDFLYVIKVPSRVISTENAGASIYDMMVKWGDTKLADIPAEAFGHVMIAAIKKLEVSMVASNKVLYAQLARQNELLEGIFNQAYQIKHMMESEFNGNKPDYLGAVDKRLHKLGGESNGSEHSTKKRKDS